LESLSAPYPSRPQVLSRFSESYRAAIESVIVTCRSPPQSARAYAADRALTAGMHAAQLKRLGRHKSFALLGDYLEFGNLIDDHSTPPWSDATNPAATASSGPATTATDGTTCLT
jgi:hypothetical protein